MPVTYRIDVARRRVYNTADATITGAEILEVQRRMVADPAFESTFSQLFDMTEVREADVSAEHIRRMAEGTAFARGSRRALVVGQTLVYGLTRMFQILTDAKGGDIEIFKDIAAAEKWLDEGFGGPEPGEDDITTDGRTSTGE